MDAEQVETPEVCGSASPWGDSRRCLLLKGHRGYCRGEPDWDALGELDPTARQVLMALVELEQERSERR
jgi:hypothetical protein